MQSVYGRFDGNVCIPVDKNVFSQNQKVLITALDEKDEKYDSDRAEAIKRRNKLIGSLKENSSFGDPLEFQRKVRSECW